MGAALAARANARRDRGGNGLLTRPKTGERILERRAKGETAERIAQALRLVVVDVAEFIKIRRRGGDARALTDTQARVIARLRHVEAPAEPALPPPPAPPPPPPVRRVPRIERTMIHVDGLAGYVLRMRRCADKARALHPDAADGIDHLADLHELCPTFYPNYVVPSDGVTLEATRRRFPERREALGGGSISAACLEA